MFIVHIVKYTPYEIAVFSALSKKQCTYLCDVKTTDLLSLMTLSMLFQTNRLERGSIPVVGSSWEKKTIFHELMNTDTMYSA